MQHQAVLLIQQYTVLQVCQPAGERDIFRRYSTTSGSRHSGALFRADIFSDLQKSGTSGQKQLNTFICGAAIKRCNCTAGQSFNLSDLCRFTRKIHTIRAPVWHGNSPLTCGLHQAVPHLLPGDRIRMQVRPRSRSAWRRNDET
uniref:Uncharacterized protein n=1 Tax=Escherichia coli TaxID=562 RepID=A0A3G4RSS9_ECOLX|nr:hypothetical protein D0368_00012 [Escherichia coli]